MVMVLPVYEKEQPGILYNTAAVVTRGRHVPGQVPQAPHSAPERLLGEVLLPPRQPGLARVRHRRRQGGGLHLFTTAISRRAGAHSDWPCGNRVQSVRHLARPVELLWKLEQPASAVATSTTSARSTEWESRSWATTTSTVRATSSIRGEVRRRGRLGQRGRSDRPRSGPVAHRDRPRSVGFLPRSQTRRLRSPGDTVTTTFVHGASSSRRRGRSPWTSDRR